jgi:hypothetical protein
VSQASNEDLEMPEDYDVEDVFEFDSNDFKDILIIVEISTCNRCKFCDCLLFDEEIMSVWSSNDSELNILCIYCKKPQVPNLYIRIKVNKRIFDKKTRFSYFIRLFKQDVGINKYLNQTKTNDRKSQT